MAFFLQGSKPQQCHMCQYSTFFRGNLTKHLRNVHKLEVVTLHTVNLKAKYKNLHSGEIVGALPEDQKKSPAGKKQKFSDDDAMSNPTDTGLSGNYRAVGKTKAAETIVRPEEVLAGMSGQGSCDNIDMSQQQTSTPNQYTSISPHTPHYTFPPMNTAPLSAPNIPGRLPQQFVAMPPDLNSIPTNLQRHYPRQHEQMPPKRMNFDYRQ